MYQLAATRQPRHFAAFHCLGADCEDTCCRGWDLSIDRTTYDRYQQCDHAELRPLFQKLIVISPAPSNDLHYAKIVLSETGCPFLAEGLCSIQQRLGEEYLSTTCASFPRVFNFVDGVLETTLDLSCPEAARIILLDPAPMELVQEEREIDGARLGGRSQLDTSRGGIPHKPYQYFAQARNFAIGVLQYRLLPLSERFLILGLFCEKLQELAASGGHSEIPAIIERYDRAVTDGAFGSILQQYEANPVVRIETVLELIVARIGSDHTSQRFFESYRTFMAGVQWTAETTMEALAARIAEVRSQYYEPFFGTREYVLEHYLVNSAYQSLFPFGAQESDHHLREGDAQRGIFDHFLLLATSYAIVRTLLVGVAGARKEAFGAADVVACIQTFNRTFAHSLTFPSRILDLLAAKGLKNGRGMAILIKD